jgi:dethiobiotin synthetase
MNGQYIIAGTDTNIGKTILSALLMASVDGLSYWKPIQSGLQEETDTEVVRRVSECSEDRIIPEGYRLTQPLSPHLSARLDGVAIDAEKLIVPDRSPLIIEMAGGLMVPLTDTMLQIELMKRWNLPVILATRSSLGTINHTLLSLEAMRSRRIAIAGVVVIGEENAENEKAIEKIGHIGLIGRIRPIGQLSRSSLRAEFAEQFTNLEGF